MDKINKAILFGGKAIVSVIDSKELANYAVTVHKPSAGAAEALCRLLSLTAFMSAGIKGTDIKLSIKFDGNGKFGQIITCGSSGGIVRGYLQNPNAIVSRNDNNHYNMQEGMGSEGHITVIKDFGMKEPYVGRSLFMRGDIDSDFAFYFTNSEQLPSAVASGCILEPDGCGVLACGAIVVQPMPNCSDEILTVLEDIVSNFSDFGKLLTEKSADDIIDYYFGHFECKMLPAINPRYECNCSQERMDNMVLSLGIKEAQDIINEIGVLEIHCDFCKKYYRYYAADLDKIFTK